MKHDIRSMNISKRQKLGFVFSAALVSGCTLLTSLGYKHSCKKRQEAHYWAQMHGHAVFERTNSEALDLLHMWIECSDYGVLVELVITDRSLNDLRRIGEMQELRSLNLWRTEVTDLTPVTQLSNLQILNLNYTQVADIAPLQTLPNLRCVALIGTQVLDFSPLATIAGLEKVYVSKEQLANAKSSLPSPEVQIIAVSDE